MSDNKLPEDAEKIAEYVFNMLAPYIEKIEYRIRTIEQRFPPIVKTIDSLEPLYNGIVLVDFFTEWCLPCYEIMPTIEKIAMEFNGKYPVKFYRIDVDKTREAVEEFNISAIPLILTIKDGKVLERLEGVPVDKREDIVRWMVLRALVPEDEYRKTYNFAVKIAERLGWRLHPNQVIRDGLIAALTWNKLQYGAYYCPCKPEKVPQNICPCKPYKNYPGSVARVETEGICHCNLFVSKEYYEKHFTV